MSECIRQAFSCGEVRQRISPEQSAQIRVLSGMANNLNQLARRANSFGYHDAYRANITLLNHIDELLKSVSNDS
jgi:hypothetical protein